MLYHYTSVSGLLGMLKEKRLWLTDASFLNDQQEKTFAKSLIINALNEIDLQSFSPEMGVKLEAQFRERVAEFRAGIVGPAFDITMGNTTGIFSLSEDGDSLAQWKAYGNQEICIAFHTSQIQRKADCSHIDIFQKVEYFSSDYVHPAIKAEVYDLLREHRASSKPLSIMWSIADTLRFKHRGFESEKEWRLIVNRMPVSPPDGSWFLRSGGRYPVPTITVPLDLANDIAGVILGPGADERVRRYLRHVFQDVMGFRRWSITSSSIPIRS